MAGSRTGTPSIWRHSVKIARLLQTYGASDMDNALGSAFGTCVRALVACVIAVYSTDDQPLQVDRTLPLGPEDLGGP